MPHRDNVNLRGRGNVRRGRSRASAFKFGFTPSIITGTSPVTTAGSGGVSAPSVAPGGQPTVPVASTGPIQPRLLPPTSAQQTSELTKIARRLKKRRKDVSTQLTGLSGLSARGDITAAQFKAEVKRQRNALAAFTRNPLG